MSGFNENRNEGCPGTTSEHAGRSSACSGCPNQKLCQASPEDLEPDLKLVLQRMSSIKHKLLVLSGKGGVGKSTISTQLALDFASQGFEVGLLDIDICGPSIPRMLGLEGSEIHREHLGWSPVFYEENLRVMSVGFMLPEADDPIIWRGPRKYGLIKQFLRDVNWGNLDYLVVDAPPGTSDEHISISQMLGLSGINSLAAIIVTTPQEISLQDVRKEINFCKKANLPVIGVVENMSSLITDVLSCSYAAFNPHRLTYIDLSTEVQEVLTRLFPSIQLAISSNIFHTSFAQPTYTMTKKMKVPFLGVIPFETLLGKACEEGMNIKKVIGYSRKKKSING
jgi:Mrp family chromosome partitioning ATPase